MFLAKESRARVGLVGWLAYLTGNCGDVEDLVLWSCCIAIQ